MYAASFVFVDSPLAWELSHQTDQPITGRDRLCLSLLLSTLETTIVSTALVSVVDALQGFDKASWIVTSYLVTYTGMLTLDVSRTL